MSTRDDKIRTAEQIGFDIIGAMDAEFHDEIDRVIAIVGRAYLDDVLESLLRAVFIKEGEAVDSLLRPDAALGSNGSRYELAFCLGLIRKHQRDDLKQIVESSGVSANSGLWQSTTLVMKESSGSTSRF
jgi:hypothetical protein